MLASRIILNQPLCNIDAFNQAVRLGLSNNLEFALDAGAARSARSVATQWSDLTLNGMDFDRGTDATAEATDPTFVGFDGANNFRPSNYWSFDGGDLFEYEGANPTWIENVHKDNAAFSFAFWAQFGDVTVSNRFISTTPGQNGFSFFTSGASTGAIRLNVFNATVAVITLLTTTQHVTGVPTFSAITFDEAIGANGCCIQMNGTQEFFTSTYNLPSASAATSVVEIAGAAGANAFSSGSKMWQGWGWSRALTPADLMALYLRTKGRYGYG